MLNQDLSSAFAALGTPQLTDACVRLGVAVRLAPHGIRPVSPGHKLAGRALPVRHYGSGDVFFEAMGAAEPGDVLVIDNAGRMDEACVGDLVVLETRACGLSGAVIWGAHRDTPELIEIGLPVFSYGTCPAGPRRLDPAEKDALVSARFGEHLVRRGDVVFADQDGALFVPVDRVAEALKVARSIREREGEQAKAVAAGRTLRQQFRFDEYLERHAKDPTFTFRKHLRTVGGAIEE